VHGTEKENPDEIVEEPKKEKKTYISILQANPLYNEVSKIVHWRDPIRSGLLFGIGNFFFILSTWGEYSIITLVSYLLLSLLTVCFGYSNYVVLRASWLQGKKVENPFKERFKNKKFQITKETIDVHVHTILDLLNLAIDEYQDVFFITDNLHSLKYALYFYIAGTIGDWFSGITLLYLVMLGFFIWPRLYEEKKKEIDHIYGIAQQQASVYFQLGLSKLPPAVTTRFPFLKPKGN